MHALIPVKRFDQAKSRLAPHLPASSRARIARLMVEHVLSELSAVRELQQVMVVSSEPAIPDLCERLGCEWRSDHGLGTGLNQILTASMHRLQVAGATRVLLLHADLPRLKKSDIEHLTRSHARPSHPDHVVLVPDRHDQGTNAMICSLPLTFDLQYGPGSFQLHREAARGRGLRVDVERIESLAWDLDVIGDLEDLPASPAFAQDRRPPLVADRKYFCR